MFSTVPPTHPDPPSTERRWPSKIKDTSPRWDRDACGIVAPVGSVERRSPGSHPRPLTHEPRIETRFNDAHDPVPDVPLGVNIHARHTSKHRPPVDSDTRALISISRAADLSATACANCVASFDRAPKIRHDSFAIACFFHRGIPAEWLRERRNSGSEKTCCPALELLVSCVGRVANTTPPQGGNTPAVLVFVFSVRGF